MTDSISRKVASGALWMLLFKAIDKSLGLISTLILVRLLDPSDFGIVAMAMSAIALAEVFSAFGFDTAIIQKKNAVPAHYNSAWTLGLITTGLVSLTIVLLAPLIADFYNEPDVYLVLVLLGLSPILVGLQNIGIVDFRKELQFQREFRFQVFKKIAGFVIAIPLAFMTGSYWALVLGSLGMRIFAVIYSYIAHPFRPKLDMSRSRELMGFSQWLLLANLVEFLKQRSSAIILGRTLSAKDVGVFSISYELANMPTTELSAPINRALLPGLAKGNSSSSAKLYAASIAALALLAIPAAVGIAALSDQIVTIVLGTKWADAGPLMQILAINGAIMLLHSSIATYLIASGLPRVYLGANVVFVVILLAMFALLIPKLGLLGAAWAYLVSSILSTPVFIYLLKSKLSISPLVFVRALTRPILCAVLMTIGLYAFALPVSSENTLSGAGNLLANIGLGILIYSATILISWVLSGRPDGGERLIADKIKQYIEQRQSRKST